MNLASKTFLSLNYPNFRLWFVSNLFAATATWMQRVTQIWVVLVILTHNDAFAVGLTTALQFLPQLFVGFLGGALADWVERRRFLQITQTGTALLGLLLGILILTDTAHLYHVYAIAFATGIIDSLTVSLRQTFLSELVPKKALPNAVGLNSTAFNIARLIGPALAGVFILILGPGWVFVLNFAIFVIPVVTLALMKKEHFYPVARGERRKGMIREGFHYVRARSDLKAIILLITLTGAFGFNLQMTQAFMATGVYGKGSGEYGLLGSMMAIGSLAGALMAARRTRPRFALVVSSVFIFGVMEALLAISPSYWLFAILSIPAGFAMITIITAANALIQISTPEELRGRVLSIYFVFNLGSTPIGSPFVGWVGDTFGARWSIGVGAIACIGVALVVFVWAMLAWKVKLLPTRHWPFFQIEGPRERYYRCDPINTQAADPSDPDYRGPSTQ
ncbi:MAG: MFS transporter [Mobiluncus porci]|nr:MFS transporter [Mobiluncus porci]MDD7541025.1 MFS transporter [Mobiluncus porci]MDY5748200.1 MFS transporter [Mobiluncus porci]